jgi:hypothetical protein
VAREKTILVVVVVATVALVATALASGAVHGKPKAGRYTGTTSESGTVSFKVVKGGKRITGFTTEDGYNQKCQFGGGGSGGAPNFTVKVPSMTVSKTGAFAGTATATVGPFSGTFAVKGRLTATGARGTVTKLGTTCGSAASNPTTRSYLETFTAKRS